MRRLFPLFILLSLSLILRGQSETDALRYALTNPTGTARTAAMGGAFGSLGGDFGSVIQNPAGLGVYRSSEFAITPEIYYDQTYSQYAGTNTDDWTTTMDFTNLSYVGALRLRGKNLVGASFGIGVNMLNNFYSDLDIQGNGITTSRADPFVASANTGSAGYPAAPYNLNPYTEKLFYDGYIMDMDATGSYYLNTDMRDLNGNISLDQRNVIERSGQMNEWSFALGLNFRHKLYVGGSFNITPLNFNESSRFSERKAGTSMEYYDFEQIEVTDGTGFGAKVGLIFKPLPFLRVGLAYHTPTQFRIIQNTYATINSIEGIYLPVDAAGYEKADSISTYLLRTPSKAIASVGLMLGKFMILSSDLELVDYSTTRYKARDIDTDFAEQNHAMDSELGYAFNLRVGAELRLSKLYLRGGFAYLGSPYAGNSSSLLSHQLNYAGGIGYRGKRMYIDFALNYQDYGATEVLYDSPYQSGVSAAAIDGKTVRAMTTIGMRF